MTIDIYRLSSATHPAGNPAETFNYDSVGNRTSSHLSTSYTTNELNRVTEDNSYLYTYDADGNLISKQNKSTNETTYFYFDTENKLVQVDKYNSTPTLISSVSYAYDGFGRRVKKNVNGVITYYVYDNEDIRFETDEAGAITAEYTHGHGIDEPLAMRRGGQNYFYHTNGLGSITALTDSTRAVVRSYVYDSFGQIISQTGSITNPYTFTGREYDPETGLYYYRARYYDARTGKFISEDPIGLAGGDVNLMAYVDSVGKPLTETNLYLYTGNNPINFIDPTGEAAIAYGICLAATAADIGYTTYTLNKYADKMLEIGGKIKAIEKQCKTDEDWVKRDEELRELRKQLIKLAEQETRAQGRGYAVGIPIAIFCAVSYLLPF